MGRERRNGEPTCLLVDCFPAVRFGVRTFLESRGFQVVGEAATVKHARELIASERPGVVIAETRLPDGAGLDLAEPAAGAGAKVVLFSAALGTHGVVDEPLRAGVRGLVRKDADLDDLARAVRVAAAGDVYIDPTLSARVVAGPKRVVTEREQAALQLVAAGLTDAAIAVELGIAAVTVHTHIRKAMKRLHAKTRAEAVAVALRRGVIE